MDKRGNGRFRARRMQLQRSVGPVACCSARHTRRAPGGGAAPRRSGCGPCVLFGRSTRSVRRSSSLSGNGAGSCPLRCRIRQHRLERGRELPGSVADEEPEGGGPLAEVHQQVAGLLRGPRSVRMAGHAQDVRSRIKNWNCPAWSPRSIRRLRACWVTQVPVGPVGWAVMPARCTRRPCSIPTST